MTQKKTAIYIMTVLLAVSAVLLGMLGMEEKPPFSFGAGTEQIRFWEKTPGERYVFLPSFASLEDLRIHTRNKLCFDDVTLSDGMTCEDLETDRTYALSDGGTITFLKTQNVPALYIDTASGNMDYVHREKGNRESGSLRLYTAEGTLDAAGSLERIKGRGNAFEYVEKKPYNLTLSSNQDLLGMGAAKNWALLTNGFDPTFLKNKLVYDFAAEAELPYSPDSRWVDLYLNGSYAGLYLLTERNEVHPERVNLSGTGNFLVSKEQPYNLEGSPYFETDAGAYLRIRYNTLRESDMAALFQQAENAILSPDGRDPETGKHWSALIDLDSWAKKYLVEEIFDGIDAGISSQFFFYDQGKIWAGPVWDYDDTMGAGIWLGDGMPDLVQIPEIFYAHRAYETPWFHSLYYDDMFHDRLTELYRQNFSTLLEETVEKKIPAYAETIRRSTAMDAVRWNGGGAMEKAEQLREYLRARMAFLNRVWGAEEAHVEVHVDYTYEEFFCKYVIFDYVLTPGQCLPALPSPEGYGWYLAGTDLPFDPSRPIYEETGIRLRKTS